MILLEKPTMYYYFRLYRLRILRQDFGAGDAEAIRDRNGADL
jgi:hypothetical protein